MQERTQLYLTEREHKKKAQEKLRLELEQQIRNKQLTKKLEKARDVYHGLKVLDSYKTQSLWNRNTQDPNPQLRQSMPEYSQHQFNYGYHEEPQQNPQFHHSQSVPKFETTHPQGTSQQIFQKTGNSVLRRNPTPPEDSHPHLMVSQPLDSQDPQLLMNQSRQNATGSNFMGDRTGAGFYEPDQLIEDNLQYLYHDSDHDQNR